ncbi:MAG: DNA topoisomerase III, partial [Oscillospiraceae bacterium]|nr:DNA topoisomerase III [Oscillospiraceae bacterium]
VGKCPRCGRDVMEGMKGFGCVGYKDKQNPCSFVLWKSNRLLETGHKSVTAAMAGKLLKGEWVTVSSLKSKAGKPYAAAFRLVDDGNTANLEMSFEHVTKKRK